MSDFFKNLETQRAAQERVETLEICLWGVVSALATVAIIKYTQNSPTVVDYLPSVLGSIPGAAIMAGIIERDSN